MICSALILSSCKSSKENEESVGRTSGIKFENLDTTVRPQDDFYKFACGGWQKNNPLKGEYSRYGSFDQLAENNQLQLKELIISLAGETHDEGTVAQKIGDLYNMGMDSLTLEEQGAEPITELLKGIADIKDKKNLQPSLWNSTK